MQKCKATNILRDSPSNFTVHNTVKFLSNFYTDKIRFYLDKQITFLNELLGTIIGVDSLISTTLNIYINICYYFYYHIINSRLKSGAV